MGYFASENPTAGHAGSVAELSPEDDGGEADCGGGVPARLFVPGQGARINIERFTVKKKDSFFESRGQAWSIQRDTAGHAGKVWKLRDPSGNRVFLLRADGEIVSG